MFSLKQPQPALPEITSQQLSSSISSSKNKNNNKLSSHTDVLKQNTSPDFTFFPILLLLCCVKAGPGCYQANVISFGLGHVQPDKM